MEIMHIPTNPAEVKHLNLYTMATFIIVFKVAEGTDSTFVTSTKRAELAQADALKQFRAIDRFKDVEIEGIEEVKSYGQELISARHIKAWEKFNEDVYAFAQETESDEVTLYEDAFTSRNVKDFRMQSTGTLSWIEDGKMEVEQMFDEDDAREWLSFWRANLRRAKRYWSMDVDTLDKIQDGQLEDEEE